MSLMKRRKKMELWNFDETFKELVNERDMCESLKVSTVSRTKKRKRQSDKATRHFSQKVQKVQKGQSQFWR